MKKVAILAFMAIPMQCWSSRFLILAEGSFKFRADYQTRQFWSDVVNLPAMYRNNRQNRERPFTINVVDNNGMGMANVRVYAFNEKGGYMGIYGTTDDQIGRPEQFRIWQMGI